MYPITSPAGSAASYQNPPPVASNGQYSTLHTSHSPPWPASQPYQSGMAVNGGTRRASATAASPQACYNCGGFNHWAQNCPEPRRAVPAGAMINQRSYKRQRPNGPVTQHPCHPKFTNLAGHNQQSNSPQRGFTHPTVGRNFQQYSGPPTPVAPHRNSTHPWPQASWLPSPRSHHPGQQWNVQGLPTPATASGSQTTSPISPASSGPQQDALPPQTFTYQHSSFQTPLAIGNISDRVSQKVHQKERRSISSRDDAHNHYQQPEVSSYNVQQEEAEQTWWQELQALDYEEASYGSNHIVSHPANPVAEALPSAMLDGDLVARLPIAASLPSGTPVSKYFRNLDVEEFLDCSVHSSGWKIGADDPALATFPDQVELVSKHELIERRRKMACHVSQPGDDNEDLGGEVCSPTSADPSDGSECEDVLGADALPTPSQSHESEEERQAREQEEKLAALGVTGFAKPVCTAVAKSVVPATSPSPETRETQDRRDMRESYGFSPGHPANNVRERRANPFNDVDVRGYGSSGSPPGGQYYVNSLQTPPTSACHDSRSDNTENHGHRTSDSAHNDPAGSPMIPKCSPDAHDWTTATASSHEDQEGAAAHSQNNAQSTAMMADQFYRASVDDGPGPGPSLPRKRSIREVSPEADEGPKRQRDKSYQKDKRKGPKVAAAYR